MLLSIQDAESGQAGGENSDEQHSSHISLIDESSDDDLVQDVLHEMKETITNLPAYNSMEDQQTTRPPLPTELLTVDSPADEPQTNSRAEDALLNADESDDSTGQVETIAFKTKIARVKPGNHISSDRQGLSNPRGTGH